MKSPVTLTRCVKVVFTLCIASITLVSCGKEDLDMANCSGSEPTYTVDIKPILDNSCATSGCHDMASAKDGIVLSTYALAFSESMNDRFLGSIQHKRGYKMMPEEAAQLSNDKVELLTCWVQNGSPE